MQSPEQFHHIKIPENAKLGVFQRILVKKSSFGDPTGIENIFHI